MNGELGRKYGRKPGHVGKLADTRVVAVAAGGYHVAALDGEITNLTNHKLNLLCETHQWNDALLGQWRVYVCARVYACVWVGIASGGIRSSFGIEREEHLLCLNAESGSVWTWGRGGSGQLGHESLQTEGVPRRVEGVGPQSSAGAIAAIACGSTWTAAVSGKRSLGASLIQVTICNTDLPSQCSSSFAIDGKTGACGAQ